MANKGKNKHLSEGDVTPYKASKRLQYVTELSTNFSMGWLLCATRSTADLLTNQLLHATESLADLPTSWLLYATGSSVIQTHNITPKLAVNSSDKEDSSVEDMQILKPMVVMKMQNPIVALDTGAQKFEKKMLPSKWLLRNTWPSICEEMDSIRNRALSN